jgi:hypothetical protein
MDDSAPPDVMLLGPEWPERALIRAQLIEAGHEVVAIDAWPMPEPYGRPGLQPRGLVIDLHGLSDPRKTLEGVRAVMPPERVLVVTALGTLTPEDVRQMGFNVIARPVTIGAIVTATSGMLSRTSPA